MELSPYNALRCKGFFLRLGGVRLGSVGVSVEPGLRENLAKGAPDILRSIIVICGILSTLAFFYPTFGELEQSANCGVMPELRLLSVLDKGTTLKESRTFSYGPCSSGPYFIG
jgi:hypothetical protein